MNMFIAGVISCLAALFVISMIYAMCTGTNKNNKEENKNENTND